jgi:hypothetical protein
MMAQQFTHAGLAPGHPGIPAGHPMGMQHPGAPHMGGQPGPGMMQGMHPGVSAPQVTQGPMVTGMPPNAGTPALGPMHNGMAMAHMGPQQAMFQQQHPQMNFAQGMTPQQQQIIAQRRMMAQMQQQGQMPMAMQNAHYNPQQMAQMKAMNMGMHPGMQMNPNHPQMQSMQAQQLNHQQQQLIRNQQAAAAAQQQAQAAAQMHHANQQRAVQAQQMQMSRSQEQTTQPPQPQPTPAPQAQPPPQPPPTTQPQQQPAQPKPQSNQATPASSQAQPPTTQPAKTSEPDEEPQIKQQPDVQANMMMPDMSKQDVTGGQCILKLVMLQDTLANPEQPDDLDYWNNLIAEYFSPFGTLRQQFFSQKRGVKYYGLEYSSIARFYYSFFVAGVRQILLHSFEHNTAKAATGATHISSGKASLTYVFDNDVRITTTGSLKVVFDNMQMIQSLDISCSGWDEYIPWQSLPPPVHVPSPDMKQSPKVTNKQIKKTQGAQAQTKPLSAMINPAQIPRAGVGEWGVPPHIAQFLEVN